MSERTNPLLTCIRDSECMAGKRTLKYLETIESLYKNIEKNNVNIDIFSSEVNKLWNYDSACLDVWFLKFFIISEKEKEKNNWNWLFTFLYSEEGIPEEVRLLNRMGEVFNGADSLYEGVKTKEKVQEIINWYFLNCLDANFEYILKRLSSNFNSLYEFKESLLSMLLPKISIFANTVGDKEFKNDVVKVLLKNIDYTKKLFIEKHYWNDQKETEFNNAFNFHLQKFALALNYQEKLPYINFTFKKPVFVWRFLESYHLLMFILNFLTPLYFLLLFASFIIPTTTELPLSPLALLLFLKILFAVNERDIIKETNCKKEKNKIFSNDNISRDTLNNEESYKTRQEYNTSIVLQFLKSDKNIDKSTPLIEEIEKYKENYIKLTKIKTAYNIQSFEICLHSFNKYLLSKDNEITDEDIERGKRIYQKVNKYFDKLIREREKEIQELNNSELDVIEKEIDSLISN